MELKVGQGREANPESDMDSKWPGACDGSGLKRYTDHHGGRDNGLGTSKRAVGQRTEGGKLRSLMDKHQVTRQHLWRGGR